MITNSKGALFSSLCQKTLATKMHIIYLSAVLFSCFCGFEENKSTLATGECRACTYEDLALVSQQDIQALRAACQAKQGSSSEALLINSLQLQVVARHSPQG